ncbi:hypothetical protein ZIOFF_003320 [Zingiber officinale]|uniref:non-specific serine/threonine protein kinase n=2 Tax=Zingiber officinale TaxID=94328 RepID=A0A8J5IT01_ZINOF|nr:hypothetical protein ZIOFF_003320 [Zingiber officinale]
MHCLDVLPTMNYSNPAKVHILLFFLLSVLLLNQRLHLDAADNNDRGALLEFKRGLQDSDSVLSDWNSSAQICLWKGISCGKGGRVIRLQLYNASLHGTISPFLSNLSQLQTLDLSHNSLHGSIPDEIGSLSNLARLDLSSNHLGSEIPTCLGMLANLVYLNLWDNPLGGNLSTYKFHNWTRLEFLDITHSNLYGPIPPQMGNHLQRLEMLFLGENNLTGSIPSSLSNISKLQRLDLSFNSLCGSIPAGLGFLSNLSRLGLSNNKLKQGIPDNFGMLSKLVFFDLSANELDGYLPTSIFYNCTLLETIHLSDNAFSGPIPPQIGSHLRALRELLLANNSLTGAFPPSLANATSLERIYLDYNHLNGPLPSDIIAQLPALEILFISYNNFSSEENLTYFLTAISNLTQLMDLGAGGLHLKGRLPSTFCLLDSLSIILLQDNKLDGTIPSNISNLQNLTFLRLSDNLLEGPIPVELFLIRNLERVWLSRNNLDGQIPSIPANITTRLGVLDISQNHLDGRIPSSISNLQAMRFLQLSENFLGGPIPSSLGSMKLEHLDLSYNYLSGQLPVQVAALSTMTWIFSLSHNLLEGELPRQLSQMDKVQAIDLSSNKFNSTIPDLRSCVSVRFLNLSHNSLQGPIPKSFGNLSSLQQLDVSSNLLSGEVPASLQQCNELKQLNLSFNQFSGSLPHGGIFDALTFDSLKGNKFCGTEGYLNCSSRTSRIAHRKEFILLLSIIASVLFTLIIFCTVAAKPFKGTALGLSRYPFDLISDHPRITYRELWEATGGFDQTRLIGSGGFGHVYKGTLRDGSFIAIKVLHQHDHNSSRIFNRECRVLKRVRHRNLMSIITTCSNPEFKAIVLTFMSKGSLEDYLHPRGDSETFLSLTEIVNICSDIAEGMAYLHSHAPVQVIHCDLKPSNILLDDDMTAIVSDFGIARLAYAAADRSAIVDSISTSTDTFLHGSVGYVAPEYGYGRQASAKGDVYSYGVIVLEMVTRKRPTDEMFDGGVSLINWVKYRYGSQLENVIDPSLVRELQQKIPEVKKIFEVAIMELIDLGLVCTQETASTRPSMISVADDLDKIKQYIHGDETATFTSSHGTSSTIKTGDDWLV